MKVELSKYLGNQDLVIGSLHEILKSGNKLPLSTWSSVFTLKGMATLPVRMMKGASFYDSLNASSKYKFHKKLSNNPVHPSADIIKKAFPKEWESYFKFAFVRNPYERLVSDYLWRRRSSKMDFSFLSYLKMLNDGEDSTGVVHKGHVSNIDMITMDGKICVDYIGRYENVKSDFGKIGDMIGLEGLTLETNQKSSGNDLDYGSFYSFEEKEIADILVKNELKLLDYDFPYNISER